MIWALEALLKPGVLGLGTHSTAKVIVDLHSGTQFARIGHLCSAVTILREMGPNYTQGPGSYDPIPIMTRSILFWALGRATRAVMPGQPP